MTDREKIIECLESTIYNAEWANKTYTDCDVGFLKDILALMKAQEPETSDAPKPDNNVGCWYDITHNYTLEQVVNALKAQEPKVMTLEEVRCSHEEPMWFESKGTFRGQKGFWVLSKGVSPSFVIRLMPAIGKDDTQLSLTVYGRVWRCWTSRPTDGQREAEPWN